MSQGEGGPRPQYTYTCMWSVVQYMYKPYTVMLLVFLSPHVMYIHFHVMGLYMCTCTCSIHMDNFALGGSSSWMLTQCLFSVKESNSYTMVAHEGQLAWSAVTETHTHTHTHRVAYIL